MEAYEAKAKSWNVEWDGHEIRFEFIIKEKLVCGSGYCGLKTRTLLFFDDKCVDKSTAYGDSSGDVSAKVQTDNGNSYHISCGVRQKGKEEYYRWPVKKFFIDRICDWIYEELTTGQYIAWINVNGKMIFLSHFGGVDDIELLEKSKSK